MYSHRVTSGFVEDTKCNLSQAGQVPHKCTYLENRLEGNPAHTHCSSIDSLSDSIFLLINNISKRL